MVTNLWPDPKCKVSDAPTVLSVNPFPNPSPVDSLAGFAAAGTATVVLDPTSAIRGAGGVKVTSPAAGSGVRVELTGVPEGLRDRMNFTVYVRARTAMTVTAAITADYTVDAITTIGWGDLGYGEAYSYVEGASYTFAAGEVKRFRVALFMKRVQNGGTYPDYTADPASDPDPGLKFAFTGAGTFDVDAVWYGGNVDDGVSSDYQAGGVYSIANAPLYFDGDTPDTPYVTYEWDGAPRASASRMLGQGLKYFVSNYQALTAEHDNAFTGALPGGERAGMLQAGWEQNGASSANVIHPVAGEDLRGFGLEDGKHYVLAMDIVSLYENYTEGNVSGHWDNVYYLVGAKGYFGYPLLNPQRRRVQLGLTAGPDPIEAYFQVYRNWETGSTAFTNVMLAEVDVNAFLPGAVYGTPEYGTTTTHDLLAAGATPGNAYFVLLDRKLNTAGDYFRVEYQAGGGWVTLAEKLYDVDEVSDSTEFQFTIPADATAVRLAVARDTTVSAHLFGVPPAYFDGDTPDDGTYAYAWTGTAGDSPSIRTLAAGGGSSITAQMFIGGAAVAVSEIRVFAGGVAVPVTEIGA